MTPVQATLIDSNGIERWSGLLETAGGGGGGQARVEISSAQLLALASAPVELVAAPGSGKAVVPYAVCQEFVAGATPYDDHASSFYLAWDPTHQKFAVPDVIEAQATDVVNIALCGSASPGVGNTPAVMGDAPLIYTADVDMTGGDGTLVITVLYATITLAP